MGNEAAVSNGPHRDHKIAIYWREKQLSQAELAQRWGLSRQFINLVEAGNAQQMSRWPGGSTPNWRAPARLLAKWVRSRGFTRELVMLPGYPAQDAGSLLESAGE